jgi:excisionase family DNA binding protein
MPAPPRRLVSIAHAADYEGVHPRTVRRQIARGDLTAYRLGSTRTLRVDLDDVDSLLRPIPTAAGGDAA